MVRFWWELHRGLGGSALRIYDAERAIYRGLGDLEWRSYLRAMWVICSDLQDVYADTLRLFDLSRDQKTLEVVRRVAIDGAIDPEIMESSSVLYGGWESVIDDREGSGHVGAGEIHLWLSLADLSGEISGRRKKYKGREWINTAITQFWEDGGTPNAPVWINNPEEEIGGETPLGQIMDRVLRLIGAAEISNEVDPALMRRQHSILRG